MNEPPNPHTNPCFSPTASPLVPTLAPSDVARELSRRYADRSSRQRRLSQIGIRVKPGPRSVHFGIRTGSVLVALYRILVGLIFIALATIALIVIATMAYKISWLIGGALIMPGALYLLVGLDIRDHWRTLRHRCWLTVDAEGWGQTQGPQPGDSPGAFYDYQAVQRFSMRYVGSKYRLRPRYTYPYQVVWVDKEGAWHPIGPIVTYEQGMLLKWELQSGAGR